MLAFFIKGFLIGFAIAAPIGPIGILCIQRSLHEGFLIGFMTGMGATLADGTYGSVAAFGITAVSSVLISHKFWIRLIGGLFLLYLGAKTATTPPKTRDGAQKRERSPWHACSTTYLLTLTSPMTILAFIAVFAGLGLGLGGPNEAEHTTHAAMLVLGIMTGSALWWLILSSSIALFLHKRITPRFMKAINWLAGSILFGFGVLALIYTK